MHLLASSLALLAVADTLGTWMANGARLGRIPQ